MRVTKMSTYQGEIPSTDLLLKLERLLKNSFDKAGFITGVCLKNRVSMKIGFHMKSFTIDKAKLGQNRDYSLSGRSCKKGYKLTTTPTWKQREEFNHIVNDCFDKLKINASIVSGDFVVRTPKGRTDHWSALQGCDRLFEIRENTDSAILETEFLKD